MRNRKFSIILAITAILVLVGGFVAYSVPPEGKGKKVSAKPIGVYDANGFLGYFMDKWSDGYTVMDPDSLGLYDVLFTYPPDIRVTYIADLLFSSDASCSGQACCSGQAYGDSPYSIQDIFVDVSNVHYMTDFSLQPIQLTEVNYKLDLATGSCDPVAYGGSQYRFPVKVIDFPLANTTLEYPIVLRPIE